MTTAEMTTDGATTEPAVGSPLDPTVKPLRAAYADPPYLGCGQAHYGHLHEKAADYDDPETHRRLLERLSDEYECWAYSLHEPSLRVLLPMCPSDARVCVWVKPFASWRGGKGNLPWAWEPVIVRNRSGRKHRTRDWVSAVPPAFSGGREPKLGVPGQKPLAFSFWLFDAMTLDPADDFCDVFPGSGAVMDAWHKWCQREQPLQTGLFAVA